MSLDLPLPVIGLMVLGGLGLLAAVAVVVSGRSEELNAGVATVLSEPEDYISGRATAKAMSDDEISARLTELDATTDWAGLAKRRRYTRRRIGDPYNHETEGL